MGPLHHRIFQNKLYSYTLHISRKYIFKENVDFGKNQYSYILHNPNPQPNIQMGWPITGKSEPKPRQASFMNSQPKIHLQRFPHNAVYPNEKVNNSSCKIHETSPSQVNCEDSTRRVDHLGTEENVSFVEGNYFIN